jgi:hypothetical protein
VPFTHIQTEENFGAITPEQVQVESQKLYSFDEVIAAVNAKQPIISVDIGDDSLSQHKDDLMFTGKDYREILDDFEGNIDLEALISQLLELMNSSVDKSEFDAILEQITDEFEQLTPEEVLELIETLQLESTEAEDSSNSVSVEEDGDSLAGVAAAAGWAVIGKHKTSKKKG